MLKNTTIIARLTFGFGAVLLLLVGMAVVSIDRVHFIDDSLTVMNDVNSVKQRYAINFRGSVHDRAISVRDVVLITVNAELSSVLRDIERLERNYAASAEKLDLMMADGTSVTPDEKQILAGIKEIEAKTLPLVKKVVQLQAAGDKAGAHETLLTEARPAFVEWLKRINQFIDLEEDKNKTTAASARTVANNFLLLTVLLCSGALMIGAAIAFWAIRSIKPLKQLRDVMGLLANGDNTAVVPFSDRMNEVGEIARAVVVFKESGIERTRLSTEALQLKDDLDRRCREIESAFGVAGEGQKRIVDALAQQLVKLAQGNLSVRLTGDFASDYARLQEDFNNAIAQLQEAMSGIAHSTGSIRSGTGEISQAADDLSRRTEQQAASLEETAAALDEITATVKKTAVGANHARDVVATARVDAERSGEVVRSAVAAMSEIEASAGKISQIIGVIDEIAFQTNLLALNAGVEAARAGDAGRGFAVVASEVRLLAQRSAEAAKEIKSLISTSSNQVEKGVELVGETGQALNRISEHVAEINGIVGEIAASAQEQATALQEVNAAVNQMDQMTQQNAAMVEQSTAASHALAGEAEQLSMLLNRFGAGEMSDRPSPSPVRKSQRAPRPAVRPLPSAHRNLALKQEPVAPSEWEEF